MGKRSEKWFAGYIPAKFLECKGEYINPNYYKD